MLRPSLQHWTRVFSSHPSPLIYHSTRMSSLRNMSTKTEGSTQRRHRFAPLREGEVPSSPPSLSSMRVQGVVFDMDGTLCEPQNHMFPAMRAAVPIPAGEDILEHIATLSPSAQRTAFDRIEAIEREAMLEQVPQPGLVALMEYLDRRKLRKAICTRNFDEPVTHLLQHHLPTHIAPFAPIVTRAFRPAKPSPAALLHIAQQWNVAPSEESSLERSSDARRLFPLLMVGDSIDDLTAGYQAGFLTVLLKSPGKEGLEGDERTDVVIERLDDLVGLLEGGITSSWN